MSKHSQVHRDMTFREPVEWAPARGADPFEGVVNRRAFLRGGAALVSGLAVTASLQSLTPKAYGNNGTLAPSPYGLPVPTEDESTGLRLISLPPGFRYKSYGWTGDPLTDGTPTPAMHDGMGVTEAHRHKVVLVRNHEVGGGIPAFGPNPYSPDAGGGNTNLVFDLRNGTFESAKTSLSGTVRNCAGGVTPWGSWISCEETDTRTFGNTIWHGYCFDVASNGNAKPKPLTDMGRFAHEAVAVDPGTGYVYETEDDGDTSGVYRFLPRKPGVLHQGGKLQMLKIAGTFQFDTRTLPCTGTVYDVEWVDVQNPNPDLQGGEQSTFGQGFDAGGTRFRRPEGIWYGDGCFFFVCTSGGPITSSGQGEGQVWMYDPKAEKLQIIYASTDRAILENPDNIVVNPDGTLMLCEDNSGSTVNAGERLHILTPQGIYEFAMNNMDFTAAGIGPYSRSGFNYTTNMRQNEWAGACFSPDKRWLFVNIQTPGVTFAITGPWVWL